MATSIRHLDGRFDDRTVRMERDPSSGQEGDDEAFPGDSPRWREVPRERETEKTRRAHDRTAPTRDAEGAIERTPDETAS